jgi:HEAT repeat protein
MRYARRTIELDAAVRDLQHKDRRVRVRAADALGDADEEQAERARSALRAALRDDDGEVRYSAALALGELHDHEAVDPLVEQMRGDGHPLARQGAVIALGAIGDARAGAPLIEALRSGAPDVRFQAALSLAQIDPAAAVAPLRRALRDEDGEVRGNAAAALAEVEDHASAGQIAALLDDPSPGARFEAAVALARLGDARGAEVLAAHLDDRELRFVAAEHLSRCPSAAVRPALQRLLGRWLVPPVLKVWAAAALVRLGDDVGRAKLLELIASRRLMTRGLCIQVMGELGADWAKGALRDLAASPAGEDWQEEIAEALGEKKKSVESPKPEA